MNANYYTTKTFLLYILGGLCFFYAALFENNTKWHSLPRSVCFIAVFFGLAQAVIFFTAPFSTALYLSSKILSMAGIFVYLKCIDFNLSDFLKKYQYLFGVFLICILSLTVENLFQSMTGPGHYFAQMMIKPFGNVNMLAEFYLFIIPLVFLWVKAEDASRAFKVIRLLKIALFVVVNIIVILSRSRSAYIGLTFWWILFLNQYLFYRLNKQFKLALCFIAFGTGLFFFSNKITAHFSDKRASTSERVNFYNSAWDLVVDHPWGIGHGYLNSIVPYRMNYASGPSEIDYPDQPHSEILKWGVQFGWAGLVAVIMTLLVFTGFVFRSGDFLLKGFFLVALPQLFFQFPFENPASILILSVVVYLFYRSVSKGQKSAHSPIYFLRFFYLILAIVLVGTATGFVKSVYNESNHPDELNKTQMACQLNPTNLRACIRKNYTLLAQGDYKILAASLQNDAAENYFASDYLKILSMMVLQSRSRENYCQIVHVYAFIYKNQSHFLESDLKACVTTPNPLKFQTPQQFDHDYKVWYFKLLNEFLN